MIHPIFIPASTKDELAKQINSAAAGVDFSRYGYEPNYTPALVERLRGFQYEDAHILVTIDGAAMVSNKKQSAESWSGADFSVVTTISSGEEEIIKGTLIQSKLGTIERLRSSDRTELERLKEQIRDMKALTRHPKVLEISTKSGDVPTIVSGEGILNNRDLRHYKLGDWVARRVLPTFDGDKNRDLVRDILDANLSGLRINARRNA